MKKIKSICTILVILMLGVLSGCLTEKEEKIHFFEDKLFYNHVGMDEKITFIVNYAYSNEAPTVEVTELKGENLEKVTYTYDDLSDEMFTSNFYNGYHVGSFYVDVDTSELKNGEDISVTDIVVKCNGEEKELHMNEKLYFKKYETDLKEYVPMQPLQIPTAMTSSDTIYPIYYVFEVREKFTLTDFYMNKYIEIGEMSIFVNDVKVEKEELLPIQLSAGDKLKIEVYIDKEEQMESASINTDLVIKGKKSDGNEVCRYIKLYLVSLGDEKDAENLTKNIAK